MDDSSWAPPWPVFVSVFYFVVFGAPLVPPLVLALGLRWVLNLSATTFTVTLILLGLFALFTWVGAMSWEWGEVAGYDALGGYIVFIAAPMTLLGGAMFLPQLWRWLGKVNVRGKVPRIARIAAYVAAGVVLLISPVLLWLLFWRVFYSSTLALPTSPGLTIFSDSAGGPAFVVVATYLILVGAIALYATVRIRSVPGRVIVLGVAGVLIAGGASIIGFVPLAKHVVVDRSAGAVYVEFSYLGRSSTAASIAFEEIDHIQEIRSRKLVTEYCTSSGTQFPCGSHWADSYHVELVGREQKTLEMPNELEKPEVVAAIASASGKPIRQTESR